MNLLYRPYIYENKIFDFFIADSNSNLIKIKSMKAKICTILSLLFIVNLNVLGQAVLLDKTTNQPISYAQILNNKGAVVGMTDIDGNLPQNLDDEIVTIQHFAYNPKNVESSQFKKSKSIFLSPIEYQLKEVTVTAKNTDYIYLRTYFRSYQLNDSCMKYFRDGFLDFFINIKHKDTERFVQKIRTFQNNELIEKDRKRTNTLVDKYIYTPYLDGLTLMESLKNEGWTYNADSIDCRLLLNEIVGGVTRLDTVQGVLRVEYDVLATKEKKPKKLFGYTTRLESFYQSENYIYKPGYQSYMDLINRKNYRKLFFSHKKDSKEQMIEIFDELYVLEHKYISKDELKQYKKVWKSESDESFSGWDDNTIVTPLVPQLVQILESHMVQVE